MASLVWLKGEFKGEQSNESKWIRLGIYKCSSRGKLGCGCYIAKGNIIEGIEAKE